MNSKLVYVPVFKGLQEENKVLRSFDFKDRMYPCLEIVKELDRLPPPPKPNRRSSNKAKPEKRFEDVYIPLIQQIKAEKVFVDLPVQIKENRSMNAETITFLRTVVSVREKRTEYLKRLSVLRSKVIPVISSYFKRTNERNSIVHQVNDLRNHFDTLAFRTTYDDFISRDFVQIAAVELPTDYLIVDWDEMDLDETENSEFIEKVSTLKCTIIIHRNSIAQTVTNTGLDHGKNVLGADNSMLAIYKNLGGHCFSDFCGIKKHSLTKGGSISPGFIYYDAVINQFFGFKSEVKKLSEFESTIVPAILSSQATERMSQHKLDFLGIENLGWNIINRIQTKSESGKSAAKFKRIGIEHYLHCLQTKINAGDFD